MIEFHLNQQSGVDIYNLSRSTPTCSNSEQVMSRKFNQIPLRKVYLYIVSRSSIANYLDQDNSIEVKELIVLPFRKIFA